MALVLSFIPDSRSCCLWFQSRTRSTCIYRKITLWAWRHSLVLHALCELHRRLSSRIVLEFAFTVYVASWYYFPNIKILRITNTKRMLLCLGRRSGDAKRVHFVWSSCPLQYHFCRVLSTFGGVPACGFPPSKHDYIFQFRCAIFFCHVPNFAIFVWFHES